MINLSQLSVTRSVIVGKVATEANPMAAVGGFHVDSEPRNPPKES